METKLITFGSVKGGVGKSTHAVALAAGLLDRGHTLRFIETDEQGSSGAWADEAAEIDENIESIYLEVGATNFEEANNLLIEKCDGPDFVLVDTAGASNSLTLAALYTADIVLSPFTLTEWDIEGLERTYGQYCRLFESFKEEVPEAFIGLHMMEVSFMSKIDHNRLEELSKKFPIRKGLPKNANIKKWAEAGRSPKHLRNGIPRAAGAQPISEASLNKVEKFITEFTETIVEMF